MTGNHRRWWSAFALLGAGACTGGCELLVQVDSAQIPVPSVADSAVARDGAGPDGGGEDAPLEAQGPADANVDVDVDVGVGVDGDGGDDSADAP